MFFNFLHYFYDRYLFRSVLDYRVIIFFFFASVFSLILKPVKNNIENAFRPSRTPQMPKMRQISVRRWRTYCRRTQMAQNVLQVWWVQICTNRIKSAINKTVAKSRRNVRQVLGLHKLRGTRQRIVLQKLPRQEIRAKRIRFWWRSWMFEHRHWRPSHQRVRA